MEKSLLQKRLKRILEERVICWREASDYIDELAHAGYYRQRKCMRPELYELMGAANVTALLMVPVSQPL
jgi:hypothetical protein